MANIPTNLSASVDERWFRRLISFRRKGGNGTYYNFLATALSCATCTFWNVRTKMMHVFCWFSRSIFWHSGNVPYTHTFNNQTIYFLLLISNLSMRILLGINISVRQFLSVLIFSAFAINSFSSFLVPNFLFVTFLDFSFSHYDHKTSTSFLDMTSRYGVHTTQTLFLPSVHKLHPRRKLCLLSCFPFKAPKRRQ